MPAFGFQTACKAYVTPEMGAKPLSAYTPIFVRDGQTHERADCSLRRGTRCDRNE